jgi:hypothetical protein
VIAGGTHATIFPEEPLEMGADAAVTGNGDLVWGKAVRDALEGRLRKQYAGGRVPGNALLKARWDLVDPRKYLLPTIQTVAGCPENCSFCSVWVTDGRRPRQRPGDKIIEEVNELYDLGFRFLIFADDNFNPATLGRIARERNPAKRKELEHIREERLRFFDEYDRAIPRDMRAFTQMTVEVVSDEEYFAAMHDKMRIRTALVGIETFYEAGLERVGKSWSPVGQTMVQAIRKIQEKGILVLGSIICGLETDTLQSLEAMRQFALDSGAVLAQFTVYRPYPGTKDYYEMLKDKQNRDNPKFLPKHKTRVVYDRFWLKANDPIDWFEHANMSNQLLLSENRKCWDSFYSVGQVWKRTRSGIARSWSLAGKLAYLLLSIAFKRVYAGHGIAADSVQEKRSGVTKALIRAAVIVYNRFVRPTSVSFRLREARPARQGNRHPVSAFSGVGAAAGAPGGPKA